MDEQKDTLHKTNTEEGTPAEEGLETASETTDPASPKPKKRRRKLWITLSVVAVVIVAAGSGFFVWHEQPSFCNAICHSPMDPYVENYYSDNQTLSVVNHRVADVTCLECHDTDLGQQINEAMAWVSGDFSDPLPVRRFGTVEFCYTCHNDGDSTTGIDWDDIVASTANYQSSGRNPHDSHLGNVDCYTCHSMHDTSKFYCTQCHDNIKKPDTW